MPSLMQRLNASSAALATSTTHALTRVMQSLHLRSSAQTTKESASPLVYAEEATYSPASMSEAEPATLSSAQRWRPTVPSSKVPLRLLQRARSSQLLHRSNATQMPIRASVSHVDVRVVSSAPDQNENQRTSWPQLSDHPYSSPLLPVDIDTSVCDFDTVMRIPDVPWSVSEELLLIEQQHSPDAANKLIITTNTPSFSANPTTISSPACTLTPPDSPLPATPRIDLGLEDGIVVVPRARFTSLPTHILEGSSSEASTPRTPSVVDVEPKKSIVSKHKTASSLDTNREGLLSALGLPLEPESVSLVPSMIQVPIPAMQPVPLARRASFTGLEGGRVDPRVPRGGSLAVHQRRRASTHPPPLKVLTQTTSPRVARNISMTDLRIRHAARTYPLPPQKAVPDYPPPLPPVPPPASPTMSTSSYYTAREAMFESYVGGQHKLAILPAWVSSPRSSIELARTMGEAAEMSSSSATLAGEASALTEDPGLKVDLEEVDDPAAALLGELERHGSPSSWSDTTIRGRGRSASLPSTVADRSVVHSSASFDTDTGADMTFSSVQAQSTAPNTPTKKEKTHRRNGGLGSMDFGMLMNESFNERSRRASRLGFAYDESSILSADELFATAVSNTTILAGPLHQHPFALARSPVVGFEEEVTNSTSYHNDVMEDSFYLLKG